jgi:hypothetical protein
MIAIVERGARMHVAREHPGRDIGRRGDGLAEPDRAQHPDRLRADIDAGADLAEMRRGLENLCGEAEFGERCRRRQPGKTAANNGDARNLGHTRSPKPCKRRFTLSQLQSRARGASFDGTRLASMALGRF